MVEGPASHEGPGSGSYSTPPVSELLLVVLSIFRIRFSSLLKHHTVMNYEFEMSVADEARILRLVTLLGFHVDSSVIKMQRISCETKSWSSKLVWHRAQGEETSVFRKCISSLLSSRKFEKYGGWRERSHMIRIRKRRASKKFFRPSFTLEKLFALMAERRKSHGLRILGQAGGGRSEK